MKTLIYALVFILVIISCTSYKNTSEIKKQNQTEDEYVRIANDSLEYEIIIMDIGFDTYLNSIAKPMNFYSQSYYEIKNSFYVTEWNNRHRNPMRYDSNIYENEIDYQPHTNYGLEVNYKLYNYFKFVEYKYKQRFF